MSGFSAEWLALREPVDHRSRSGLLLDRLRDLFADRATITVVDLGCGTGSNLRACAPHLPPRQEWLLVDHDPALLSAARKRLTDWAERSEDLGDQLRLDRDGREIMVSFTPTDLARGVEPALGSAPHLVTAAALLDLVSAAWIEDLAAAVASRCAVFYTALTYNGALACCCALESDAEIFAGFQVHQRRDKGFGPSAGPDASRILEQAFASRGYDVQTADSSWRLGPDDADFARETAKAVAQAAAESGTDPDIWSGWLHARLASASVEGSAWSIGHTDLIAVPRHR